MEFSVYIACLQGKWSHFVQSNIQIPRYPMLLPPPPPRRKEPPPPKLLAPHLQQRIIPPPQGILPKNHQCCRLFLRFSFGSKVLVDGHARLFCSENPGDTWWSQCMQCLGTKTRNGNTTFASSGLRCTCLSLRLDRSTHSVMPCVDGCTDLGTRPGTCTAFP